MQTTNKKDLELRSRYYQGLIDIDFLAKNEEYKNLKESFIIFICTFDPFGEKLPIYTVKHHFAEKPNTEFDDRTRKIFYNVKEFNKIQNDNEIKGLLEYLCNKKTTTTLTNTMENAVIENKTNKNWSAEYMFLSIAIKEEIDEGIAEGIAKGIAQGKAEGIHQNAIEIAKRMLKENFDIDTIAKITQLSVDVINSIK